jgi:hypothetical protein
VQVMYDASGVRLHAGRQASVLNMIITELPPDHPVSDTRPLRDSLGHTPLQVGFLQSRSRPSSSALKSVFLQGTGRGNSEVTIDFGKAAAAENL